MPFDPQRHHRRSIRLRDYDYSQAGAYFVTLVTFQRTEIFGTIVDGTMILNTAGQLVATSWLDLEQQFPGVALDEFIIMPNHLHGVIFLQEPGKSAPMNGVTLGRIIGALKSLSLQKLIAAVHNGEVEEFPGKVWQRNYYEHVIRNDRDLNAIREYIQDNPLRWELDQENIHPGR